MRLKAAASFAESGDIHDVVEELWKGAGTKKQTLIDTVSYIPPHNAVFYILTGPGNRSSP